jgi:hypothetical protein
MKYLQSTTRICFDNLVLALVPVSFLFYLLPWSNNKSTFLLYLKCLLHTNVAAYYNVRTGLCTKRLHAWVLGVTCRLR